MCNSITKHKKESILFGESPDHSGQPTQKKRADRRGEGMGEEAIDTTPQELN